MSYDIPTVAAAMDQKIMQLDNMTNNLANAGTPGFKAQHLHVLKTIEEGDKANEVSASVTGMYVDFSQGISQKTGNPLDLHLQGDGFFVVQTREGQAFTRKGDFAVNKSNQIVTQAGDTVIGDGGPITLKDGKINISQDGSVYVDESQVGKIKIVDFTNRKTLSQTGGGLYRDPGTAGMKKVEQPLIMSGFIELSNVNIVKEMAKMIDIHRSFETYQKIIQTLTEQDKLTTGRVGRVA